MWGITNKKVLFKKSKNHHFSNPLLVMDDKGKGREDPSVNEEARIRQLVRNFSQSLLHSRHNNDNALDRMTIALPTFRDVSTVMWGTGEESPGTDLGYTDEEIEVLEHNGWGDRASMNIHRELMSEGHTFNQASKIMHGGEDEEDSEEDEDEEMEDGEEFPARVEKSSHYPNSKRITMLPKPN